MRTDATIHSLIDRLAVHIANGDRQTPIHNITEDSRTVTPGSLFIARPGGAFDGRRFVNDAIARGASAILHDGNALIEANCVVDLHCENPATILPVIAERFFGNPSRTLQLIGITGTNGKTTVATLIYDILNRIGHKCGLMGTVMTDNGASRQPTELTTPPAIEISRTLAAMVDNGCHAAAMEVSSHALHQGRTAGLAFNVGVFTNLSGDHLDYHGTLGEYEHAKAILFKSLTSGATAVLNADDPVSSRMEQCCAAHIIRTGFGDTADPRATIIEMDINSTLVHIEFNGSSEDIELPLVGRYNVSNAIQAVATIRALGVDMAEIIETLQECTAPPGRLEPIRSEPEGGPTVLVDYAHTDDALQNVLQTIRATIKPGAKLWVVFGCGGDRDQTKRPRMAEIACATADRVVVTSDNPRNEDPQQIIDQILLGVPRGRAQDVVELIDRRRAILFAVMEANDEDIILIAGKGHEDYQIIGPISLPFDDRIIAREALNERAARCITT